MGVLATKPVLVLTVGAQRIRLRCAISYVLAHLVLEEVMCACGELSEPMVDHVLPVVVVGNWMSSATGSDGFIHSVFELHRCAPCCPMY